MRITLADIQTRPTAINKDLSGGYGTSSDFGSGWLVGMMKRLKRNAVKLPIEVNGKVYQPTFSKQFCVYGRLN